MLLINSVAPYVGAWIETLGRVYRKGDYESHPTWVRGLKQNKYVPLWQSASRTLRGCVD